MKIQTARVLIIVFCSAILTFSLANKSQLPSPPCSQLLKMGFQTWMEKNQDAAEVGLDNAALDWAECKSASNQALLINRPKSKIRLNKLSALENQFIADETDMASWVAGGGTLYRHEFARFQATLEMHLETMIVVTGSNAGAKQSAAINARYKSAKSKLKARIARVQLPKPFVLDGATPEYVAEQKERWKRTANDYRQTYVSITKVIGSRIDLAATLEMEFLAQGLWADEI
jgi:hypothetical protein